MKIHFRLKKFCHSWLIIPFLTLCIIAFNELIIYELCYFKWKFKYNWSFSSSAEDLKILFVADSQLIGLENEKRQFEDLIRWDADRFLAKGFSKAIRYAKPDVVVFLGDIFDEGELASDSQYYTYMERFNRIFMSQLPENTRVIIMPGDNDVGGEGASMKTKFLMERFYQSFKHNYPYMETFGKVNFIAADVSSRADFDNFHDYLKLHTNKLDSKYNIIVNHNSRAVHNSIISKLGISAVISAHTHKSRYQICHSCSSKFSLEGKSLETYSKVQFHLTKSLSSLSSPGILQITVPTCSYRMGVHYPGYGVMTIGEDGLVTYMVLWLPYRFQCLYLYQVTMIFIAIFVILKLCRLYF